MKRGGETEGGRKTTALPGGDADRLALNQTLRCFSCADIWGRMTAFSGEDCSVINVEIDKLFL